jgi:cation diffusion facilitator CzcD-associated flavoprotein CzcO
VPVVVVGAGPAGLAVSRELAVRGVAHVVLEADSIGSSWARYYRSLVLHTGKHLSHLPGRRLPRDMPLFPPRDRFLRYLRDYAAHFRLPVREGVRVHAARCGREGWELETGAGRIVPRILITATGISSNPYRPVLEGEEDFGGEVMHSASYVDPEPFRGKRVLVVGVGNSGGEIAAELARAGVETIVSARGGAHLMPLRILGLPSQYWGVMIGVLPARAREGVVRGLAALRRRVSGPPPLPPPDRPILARPPLIGDSLPAALRSGRVRLRGAVARLVPEGVRFADGAEERVDVVILATGFRPELAFFAPPLEVDGAGFPGRAGVRSLDLPDLFFVGLGYGASGVIPTIRREAREAAREVAALLGQRDLAAESAGRGTGGGDQGGGPPTVSPASP